ncbi:Decaprenylphosphoryl-2-keto-beta-D-erythro-pentose reductase [Halioglobus japonicus]|nr:Decaprenylphosphoryl-2-keto-beta-D-erythro-pentose reductase [Halioglobus japonicus]
MKGSGMKDSGMKSDTRILVFGATSAICHEVLKLYAAQGASFFLVARNHDKLGAVTDDLVARGARVDGSCCYDFNDWEQHEVAVRQGAQNLGAIDIAIVAHGTLPEQAQCESSSAALKACMDDNFTSAAIVAEACAQQLSRQGSGALAVVSSVAGDRGRKSNYAYGAAKAGIDTLLQGLQGRFSGSGVKIVNIKPGMIISPMTAHLKHGAIWATAADIAPDIQKAIASGRKVCYVPGYWRLIMFVIRSLPTTLLAKLPI